MSNNAFSDKNYAKNVNFLTRVGNYFEQGFKVVICWLETLISSVTGVVLYRLAAACFCSMFSRRFSREKCPTLTVASFFSFFFVRLQSHSDWATFLTIEATKTTTIRPSPVSGN